MLVQLEVELYSHLRSRWDYLNLLTFSHHFLYGLYSSYTTIICTKCRSCLSEANTAPIESVNLPFSVNQTLNSEEKKIT